MAKRPAKKPLRKSKGRDETSSNHTFTEQQIDEATKLGKTVDDLLAASTAIDDPLLNSDEQDPGGDEEFDTGAEFVAKRKPRKR